MRRFSVVALAVLILFAVMYAAAPARADRPVQVSKAQVRTASAPMLTAPPIATPAQLASGEEALAALAELRRQRMAALPPGTAAPPAPGAPTSLSAPGPVMSPQAPAAPGDFSLFRSTLLTDAFTNNFTSSTDEPSLGMNCETIFYTGNWYASFSADGGQTFTFVDPATTFPAFSGGFCCDQVVYYDESRDLMFWYVQYSRDGNGNNTIVLAWSSSNLATQNGLWTYISLSPQADFGYGNGVWFDFPEMSISDNFVYFTTDVINATENALALKMNLDDAIDGGGVTLTGFFSEYPFLRPTHGATGTMYIGAHKSMDEMRLYTWAEADNAPGSSDDRGVNTWLGGTYSAPSPDGTDYLNFGIPGLLAAWIADGKIGFMWDSVQGDGYPWPNVRYATFNVGGLGVANQGVIWNAEYAFAYPSVHPNDSGDIAGTMAVGGGSAPPANSIPYPSFVAWIADDYNGDVIAPAEAYLIQTGDSGPASNRWGDYLTSRRAHPYGNTWAATGFVLTGGQTPADTDPYFIWFGRAEDVPGPTIDCPDDITVECSDPCGLPKGNSQLSGFFSGVMASDLCDVSVTNDAPDCFGFGTTTVTFTAEDDLGLTASCTADVTVVDTTPPTITHCPPDTTVECTNYCGVPDDTVAVWLGSFAATDVCDANPVLSDNSPDCFPLGTTTVTFKAQDAAGNMATCTADLEVVDTTPPEITVTVDPDALWPPNHKLVCISATVTVVDICDPDPQWVLESITSNEPDNGKGDGNTVGDIAEADTGTTDVEFKLRSERDGRGDGRKYTIIYRAWDASGNVAWDTACVYVPHDQGAHALAWVGYNTTGTNFELGAQELGIILLSHPAEYGTQGNREILVTPGLDASSINVSRAYIGNTAGVATPTSARVIDANQDGLKDLMLTYAIDPVRAIQIASSQLTVEQIEAGAIWDGSVGLHVWGADKTGFLVSDVFALGEPVVLHVEDDDVIDPKRDLPTADVTSAEKPERFDNGIASIVPNPFNPRTTVRFTLAEASQVTIAVYDVSGRLVSTLVSGNLPAGEHTAAWDGTDLHGSGVATGVYFARMVAGSFTETRKMVLLK